jgi:hypothetical protein
LRRKQSIGLPRSGTGKFLRVELRGWQPVVVIVRVKEHSQAELPKVVGSTDPIGFVFGIAQSRQEQRIEYLAKAIADWVWPRRDHFGRSGQHRRKTTDEELLKIRSDNAYKTAEIKQAATEEKIKKAMDQFLREGRRITKAAIAREAGISREAVSRYYSHLF